MAKKLKPKGHEVAGPGGGSEPCAGCGECWTKADNAELARKAKSGPKTQRKVVVVCGKKTKTITLNRPGVLTIFMLGDRKRGWIPNIRHFDRFRELIADVEAGRTDKIIWHYGLEIKQVRLGAK